MSYDITDAKEDIQALAAQNDFLYKVCQALDKFIIDAGNASVFEEVKKQMEEEAKGEEEDKVDTPGKKGKGKKNPLA